MITLPEEIGYRTVDIEGIKVAIEQRISDDFMRTLQNPIEVQVFFDYITEQLVLRLQSYVHGERISKVSPIVFPSDWIEAVKERFLPKWAKKAWPVKYTTQSFDSTVIYDKISLPNVHHHVRTIVHTNTE